MNIKFIRKWQFLGYLFIAALLLCSPHSQAQNKTICGNVYSFKNLCLKNIKVTARKSTKVVYTDSLGNFCIAIHAEDKLIFTGSGFQKSSIKVADLESPSVKLIFNGGLIARKNAIEKNHVTSNDLENSIASYSHYNSEYVTVAETNSPFQEKYRMIIELNNHIYHPGNDLERQYSFIDYNSYPNYKNK